MSEYNSNKFESNSFSIPISIEKIDEWLNSNTKYFIWEDTVI